MDLYNYAKKADFKGTTEFHISTLASKTDLASLETKVGNLDVGKLKTAPVDLSKLSNVVDNDAVNRFCKIDWLSKSMLLLLRYQVLVDRSLKHSMIRKKTEEGWWCWQKENQY